MKATLPSVLSSIGQVSNHVSAANLETDSNPVTDSDTDNNAVIATKKTGRARKRVVIVGAGFAGLYAAKKLKSANVDVLLIDKNNYHTFQPLLYQVATSALNPDEIAHSVRATFRNQKNFDFLQGTVKSVDWTTKEVILTDNEAVDFDYLILATGAIYNDFGVEGIQDNAFFLKSLGDAINLRSHILECFEKANKNPEKIENGLLNIVIVGGGPTGVEMAGALSELYTNVLRKDFPKLDFTKANIILVEQADTLLGQYSEGSGKYAEENLVEMGADIRLGESVTSATTDSVTLASGEVIPCHTLVWAAGVRAHPLAEALNIELTRGYRIAVDADLSIPTKKHAFVAGDLAGATDSEGNLLPQLCPVAIQQGSHVAKQIIADLNGRARKDFKYFDKGTMAIVGRNAGIAEMSPQLSGLKLRGFIGWLAWLFLHIVYLIGFQNRFLVLSNWFYSYISRDRHARLIIKTSTEEDLTTTNAEPKRMTA